MKYPRWTASAVRKLTVPALNGGIHASEDATLIADNQLAGGKNIFWKNGALRTRPGVSLIDGSLRKVSDPERAAEFSSTVTCATGCTTYFEGKRGEFIASVRRLEGTVTGSGAEVLISLLLEDGTRIDTEPFFVNDDEGSYRHTTVLLAKGDAGIVGEGVFAYMEGGRVYEYVEQYRPASQGGIRRYWLSVTDRVTVPVVLTAGRGYASHTESPTVAGGTVVRSFNALTDKFIAEYTTDDSANAFVLPLRTTPAKILTVAYTDENDEETVFQINGREGTVTIAGVELTMLTSGNTIRFLNDGADFPIPAAGITNNLRITAQYGSDEGVMCHDIGAMQVATWFGGTAGGLYGGSRLFVGGDADHPNKLCWSALDDPLYFPVNNYATVGEIGEAITAFGKQGDMLVIFKEHSIFGASYTVDEIRADEVVDGSVVDLEAASALFPIRPIHATIGCDCPGTVALCANRLVWATTDRRVFSLVGVNAFSERNVRELTAPIRPVWTPAADEMKNAVAADIDGYYLLAAGSRAAALLYGDTAPDGERWFLFDIPATGISAKRFISHNGQIQLFAEKRVAGENDTADCYWSLFRIGGGIDRLPDDLLTVVETPVIGELQTKYYDFGHAERYHRILRVYPHASGRVRFSWLTDNGRVNGGNGEVLSPAVPHTVRFGIAATLAADSALMGLTITARTIGEKKG